MKRTPVTRLDPLTQEQIQYLFRQGARYGDALIDVDDDSSHEVWWMSYFADARADSYLDQGFDLSGGNKFIEFRDDLAAQLKAAKNDPKIFKKLAGEGQLPPPDPRPSAYSGRHRPTASHRVLVSALYEPPEYMQWWQAENAFRRGYQEVFEEHTKHDLLDLVRDEVRENDGMTVKAMRAIAERFEDDPVVYEFFTNLASEFEEDIAPSFNSVSQLMTIVDTARAHSYQQFDPRFKALRWVGGGLAGRRG
jgi:hypothetical protein